jgi:CheY-like chemotaxis protein
MRAVKTARANPRAFNGRSSARVGVRRKVRKAPVILIVEDEPLIRLGAVGMIEEAGFEIVQAVNADEAIQILEKRRDVRVVFTDIQMPGSMDGLKLAHAIRNRWPPIKIIVTSGRERITERDLPEGGCFFSKPYGPVQIRDVIREWTL